MLDAIFLRGRAGSLPGSEEAYSAPHNRVNRRRRQELAGHHRQHHHHQLQDLLSRGFYRHGLICASHPRPVLILTLLAISWTCYPLLNIPIFGARPHVVRHTVGPNLGNDGERLVGQQVWELFRISEHRNLPQV